MCNFIFYLHYEKKTVFQEWVILNQSTNEELGESQGGLRALTSQQNNLIVKHLEREFKAGFLTMS